MTTPKPRAPLSAGKSSGPIAKEARWAPGTVQTVLEKIKSLNPTWVGIRTVQPVVSHLTDCALLARVYKSTADMHVFEKSEVLVALKFADYYLQGSDALYSGR